VLDEAHVTKNHAVGHSKACVALRADRRWLCTGASPARLAGLPCPGTPPLQSRSLPACRMSQLVARGSDQGVPPRCPAPLATATPSLTALLLVLSTPPLTPRRHAHQH
jgi:hypothetical protein